MEVISIQRAKRTTGVWRDRPLNKITKAAWSLPPPPEEIIYIILRKRNLIGPDHLEGSNVNVLP